MQAKDAAPGAWVEIMQDGEPTGRVYCIAKPDPIIGEVTALSMAGGGLKVQIHPLCDVRSACLTSASQGWTAEAQAGDTCGSVNNQ
jgi:hypothetical protein